MRKWVLPLYLSLLLFFASFNFLPANAPCNSPACQACVDAGHQADDLCTFLAQRVRLRVRERFIFTGQVEGHDGAGNLLKHCKRNEEDICNISSGTCTEKDEGCVIPLVCSGRKKINTTCKWGQHCVGEWQRYVVGQWEPIANKTCISAITPWRPTDCDCISCTSGFQAFFKVCSKNANLVSMSKRPLTQRVDPGYIHHKGWEGKWWIDKAYRCGFYSEHLDRCAYSGFVLLQTKTGNFREGNPDYQ